MIRLGINLWHRDLRRLEKLLEEAQTLGINHAEISADFPFGVTELESFEAMAKVCRERGFTLSIHAPWHEISLASPLEELRAASVEITKKVVRNAYRVEALYVVLHVTSSQPVCRGRLFERCVDAARRSVAELSKAAEELGLYLAVENVGDPCCGRVDQLSRIVEPPAYACIDVAHAYSFEEDPQRAVREVKMHDMLARWVSAIGRDRVLAIHLHGVRARGKKLETHLEIRGDMLDPKAFAKEVSRCARFLVFEVFKKLDGSESDISSIASIVRELRSWILVYA
ncbi:MAG: TIM barrel protein [Crenarchaeota archaeon]|nr:TIM barrel protein [Thermoproteota archaeon]